jgi:plastocyanin
MKTKLGFIAVLSLLTIATYATKHTIGNNGTSFSPADITIAVGDTVDFNIASMHNAVEVSKSTWNANETTSNGGFQLPLGGGSVNFPNSGDYYYVCVPHAQLGMKGVIHVVTLTAVLQPTIQNFSLDVFPNPASKNITIAYNLDKPAQVDISLYSLTGAKIQTIITEQQNAGTNEITYSLNNNFNPGIYFIKLQSVNGEQIRKLIID